MSYSFFYLTTKPLTANDALPGITADEDTFLALIETLHDAIDTFQDAHPEAALTWGDCIHATKCVVDDLAHGWAADMADA